MNISFVQMSFWKKFGGLGFWHMHIFAFLKQQRQHKREATCHHSSKAEVLFSFRLASGSHSFWHIPPAKHASIYILELTTWSSRSLNTQKWNTRRNYSGSQDGLDFFQDAFTLNTIELVFNCLFNAIGIKMQLLFQNYIYYHQTNHR